MKNNGIIIKLPVQRWKEYKALRLEALKKESSIFVVTYREVLKKQDKDWKKELCDKNILLLFVEHDGMLVGMLKLDFDERKKLSHLASLRGVYIQRKYRNSGIFKLLFADAISHLKKRKILKIKLIVSPYNQKAFLIYKHLGFQIVGRLKKEIRVGNVFRDDILMEKLI
jgi:ribosomal protein S18 acetylase RimI-like enzyme